MTWTDYDYAIRFRDTVRKIVREFLDQEFPPDKTGRVVDIDRASGIARVVYSSDMSNPVRVRIYPGTQPLQADSTSGEGNGSRVRVSGKPGARYVSQVLNSSAHQVAPRLVNPSIGSGGSGDDTLRSMYSFTANSVPPPDNTTVFALCQIRFPKFCGSVDVRIEMLDGVSDSYAQRDSFMFDRLTTLNTNLATGNAEASSVGMSLSVLYKVTADGDEALVDVSLLRDTSSRTPTSMSIHLDVFGTNAELVQVMDGVS